MKKIIVVSRCAWTLYNFRKGLINALGEAGNTVLYGGAEDGWQTLLEETVKIPFHSLPVDKKGKSPLSDLKLIWHLYRWYRKEKPDVVHHFTIKPVIYGSIAARLAGVPQIVNTITGLGYVFTDRASPWLRLVVKWQYRIALACSHFTFFQNQDDRRMFIEQNLIHSRHSGVLPGSGVDTTFFSPDEEETYRENSETCCFLMVARLLQNKGVYEFVDAARHLKQEFPQAQFKLIGRRDERNPVVVPQSDLEKWQEEGVIEWLGEMKNVRNMLIASDVVVLPSYYREGVPRALLEGAAMEKPLITTDNVGCREVVDDEKNGLIVPIKDSKALAQAMRRLIKDPIARQRMGKAGREKILREFDETIVIKKTIDIYNDPSRFPNKPGNT